MKMEGEMDEWSGAGVVLMDLVRKIWMPPQRRGPVHSFENCSVVHEAKNKIIWIFLIILYCGAHRASALKTPIGRVTNFQFRAC